MATGWLRGTVKEVPSGDTVVVVGNGKGGMQRYAEPQLRGGLNGGCCPMLSVCIASSLRLLVCRAAPRKKDYAVVTGGSKAGRLMV